MHPVGHTRLPRYVRGKFRKIDRDHGAFVFPDTNAHFLGEQPHMFIRYALLRESYGARRPARKIPCM
jgi:nitrile hydratase